MRYHVQKATVLLLAAMSGPLVSAHAPPTVKSMENNIDATISFVKKGITVPLDKALPIMTVNGVVSPAARVSLARALTAEDDDAREEIVHFIVELGIAIDSPAPGKERLIRDRSLVRLLLDEALSKTDSASSAAEDALLKRTGELELLRERTLILESLKNARDSYVLIAAKAKIPEARPYIERLLHTPNIDPDVKTRSKIALAALGDTELENRYLAAMEKAALEAPKAPKNKFYNIADARDGTRAAKLIKTLGLIGTKRALIAVCTHLRSDLKTYVVNIEERSLRFDAIDALSYNFPDEIVFRRPSKTEHWEAIEKFCIERVGATFSGPTPDAVVDFGYPRY